MSIIAECIGEKHKKSYEATFIGMTPIYIGDKYLVIFLEILKDNKIYKKY